MNMQRPLTGKIAQVHFDSGFEFQLEYLDNSRMKWTSLKPEENGKTETEDIQVIQTGDGQYTVHWVESTGNEVVHVLDINKKTVRGIITWPEESAYGGRHVMTHKGSYGFVHSDGSPDAAPFTNLQIVTDFWEGFFNKHDMAYADKYLQAPYTQHNPGVDDGVTAFKKVFVPLFENEYRSFHAEIVHTACDDDLVYLHNRKKTNPTDIGQAGVDIFRVTDGRITEHWDIIQDIPEKAANGHPMF